MIQDTITNDFDRGALAMIDYIYNTSEKRFMMDVFGPNYLMEKADSFGASPARAIGFLDEEHMQRLFAAVRKMAKMPAQQPQPKEREE